MAKREPKAPAEEAAVEKVQENVGNEEPKAPAEEAEAPRAAKKGGEFTVFDSNGKVFRVVKDEEEANRLANTIGGKFK